ncbi:hypothetical protein ACFXTI_040343 [Malus domestica]
MGGGKDEKHETTEKALFSYGSGYGSYPPQGYGTPRKHIKHTLLLAGILQLPILLMGDIHPPPIHRLVIQGMELLVWEWEEC